MGFFYVYESNVPHLQSAIGKYGRFIAQTSACEREKYTGTFFYSGKSTFGKIVKK